MLPAANRMRSSVDFAAAIRRGRRTGRRTLVVHYRSGVTQAEAVPPRVGLVVSKAVGGSVVRNRVKRRLRHLLAGSMDLIEPGALVVVRANRAAAGEDARLAADLESALRSVVQTGHRAVQA